MAGHQTARDLDPVLHPFLPVMQPGPGSFNVVIRFCPAWHGGWMEEVMAMQSARLIAGGNAGNKAVRPSDAVACCNGTRQQGLQRSRQQDSNRHLTGPPNYCHLKGHSRDGNSP